MSPSHRILVAIIAVAVAVVFILLAIHLITGGYVPSNYSVVVGLKSPNTTITLYKWEADLKNNTGLVDVDEYCESTLDVDDLTNGFIRDVNSLIPCLNRFVNKSKRSQKMNEKEAVLDVFVGATSSMRHLLLTDADAARQQLDDIKYTLKAEVTSSNLNNVNLLPPKILNDEDEATFLWISVNYLSRNLASKNDNKRKQTDGVIYIDEYSSLLAYEASNQTAIKDPRNVQLYEYNYTLRADGNLCTGIDAVYNRYLALLIMREVSSTSVSDPCGSNRQQRVVDGSELAKNGCLLKNKSIEIDTTKSYLIVSHYNYEQCLSLIESIFDEKLCSAAYGVCPPAEASRPEFYGSFVVMQRPRLSLDPEVIAYLTTIEEFVNTAKLNCDVYNRNLTANSENGTELTQCFAMNYYYVLLTRMYKLDDENWHKLRFDTRPSGDAHWPLGYTIYVSSFAAAVAPTEALISMHIILITFAICLILITVAVCFIRRQLNNDTSDVSIVKVY